MFNSGFGLWPPPPSFKPVADPMVLSFKASHVYDGIVGGDVRVCTFSAAPPCSTAAVEAGDWLFMCARRSNTPTTLASEKRGS